MMTQLAGFVSARLRFGSRAHRAAWWLPTIGAAVVLGCAPRSRSAESATARTVSVLVYNIHAGKDAAGADNLARVAEVVRSTGADVVLLQEVDRGTSRSGNVDQPAELARLTGFSAAFGRTLDYQGGQYGIAILSRWPIGRDTLIHLPIEPPQPRAGGSYEPRGALWATVDAPGGPIVFVNTHLDASREDGWRRQEIRTVLAIADSAATTGTPMLLGGDFNSEPSSAVHSAAVQSGLRDAWLVCGRAGSGLTYPADSAIKRIDYLFLRGDASCDEATVPRSDASDHLPLLVHVRLPR